ncbi:nickel import ATP-binding protein NikD [Pseudomonas putida]|uniref:nickel import ATP-binding protein NikD n=1 Tax=Pseudomonas putida TaxID=303 RepID=UPI0008193CA1|nr:nickel import ATP-binding protein NikD [Pseudomonas putida]OCT21217.1 nickel import ATP-binding protein NikD [Pseudomonas putida]OCT22610.1 nickel import ATP-binding protein NikD [Pseudomonas putida]OCT37324.1 nickel import ATP-binding protein NikD [Pseudomonas putida]OCT40778.1 nickel import ATP-binding protein NikD [Pseudomonas putida]
MMPLTLEIQDLRIASHAGALVHDVDLQLRRGEVCALVGASGSGKSLSCLGMLDLLPAGLVRIQGQLLLDGQPVSAAQVRGRLAGLVLQNPRSAFNPVSSMASHGLETLRQHGITAAAARERMADCLAAVGLTDHARVLQSFAFQLSGGMLQRMMIALALMAETPFLLADEPTSDLDAVSQARFLDVLMELVGRHGLGVLLVTHDMGVVARCADQVAVMDAGRIVERQAVHALFDRPASDTARTLLEAHRILCGSQA